jgi:hypothetical protein
VRVVVVDMAVARGGHGVDGALALLEARRGHFGCVYVSKQLWVSNGQKFGRCIFSPNGGLQGCSVAGVGSAKAVAPANALFLEGYSWDG